MKVIFKTTHNIFTITLRSLRLIHPSKHLKLFVYPNAICFLNVWASIVLLDNHFCSFARSTSIYQLRNRWNKCVLLKLLQWIAGIRRSPRINASNSTVYQIGNTFRVYDGIPLVLQFSGFISAGLVRVSQRHLVASNSIAGDEEAIAAILNVAIK